MTKPNTAHIQLLQARLLDEQREIEKRFSENDHYGLANSLRDTTGELSTIDNHPGDVATELYEREKDVALHEQEELHLNRIEAALTAIADGTYGICKTCNEPIPLERLDAVPDTLYCIEHAPRQQLSLRRRLKNYFSILPLVEPAWMSMIPTTALMARMLGKLLSNGAMLIHLPHLRIEMLPITSM